jgi:hypothetical protein
MISEKDIKDWGSGLQAATDLMDKNITNKPSPCANCGSDDIGYTPHYVRCVACGMNTGKYNDDARAIWERRRPTTAQAFADLCHELHIKTRALSRYQINHDMED